MSNATAPLAYSPTIRARLAARSARTDAGCIEWMGSRLPSGYGRIGRGWRGGGVELTHRAAWELENGPIPTGMYVMHTCDNPPCLNIEHLRLGTPSDNTSDMLSKGRGAGHFPAGESHPSARLSDDVVATLRSLAPLVQNNAELGRMFGISTEHARALRIGMKRTR